MIGVHVAHQVKDFDDWFQNFKTAPVRNDLEREYGLKTPRVIQDVRNPGHCNVVVQAPDAETFNTFWNDPQIISALEKRSDEFITPPQIWGMFRSHNLENENESHIGLVEHHLKDFDAWFEAFSIGTAGKGRFSDYGMTAIRVLQNIETPGHCIAVWAVPDEDALGKFRADPRTVAQIEKISAHLEKPPELLGTWKVHQIQ